MVEIRTKIPGCKAGVGDFKQVVGYRRYICGVDLGTLQDATAISIIEDELIPAPRYGKGFIQEFEPRRQTLVQAFRLKVGLEWPVIVDTIKQVKNQVPDCSLWIDTSGIGQPVGAMLKEKGVAFTGLTITSGDRYTKVSHDQYRCSKSYLVSYLNTQFQTGELRISEGIKDAKAFRTQVEDFESRISPSGQMTWTTRDGAHDDLLLSTAIAALGSMLSQNSSFKVSPITW